MECSWVAFTACLAFPFLHASLVQVVIAIATKAQLLISQERTPFFYSLLLVLVTVVNIMIRLTEEALLG